MCSGVLWARIVRIVGGHEWDTEPAGESRKAVVDGFLFREPVGLNFQVVVALPKNGPVFSR